MFTLVLAIVSALLIALLLWYAVSGRNWLKSKSWAEGFFAWIEPAEIVLFKKSETILVARVKMATGLLLTLFTQIGAIDITPLMPFVPEKYKGYAQVFFNLLPISITLIGWMDEHLRKMTTQPLELVAAPDNPPAVVSQAIAQAEAAKVQAVEVVVQAKQDKVL